MRTKVWWSEMGDETLTETAWERQMLTEGMEAFEKAIEGKGLTENSVGQGFLRKMVPLATESIFKVQKEMTEGSRVDKRIRASIISVPCDTAALLTLQTLTNRIAFSDEPDEIGANYQRACVYIAEAIETELNFRNWISESLEDAKEYKEKMGLNSSPQPFALRLVQEQGGVTSRNLRRWRETFSSLSEYSWGGKEKHFIGEVFLKAVLDALPLVFELHKPNVGGKLTKHVKFSTEIYEDINQKLISLVTHQSTKKPMISKPEHWDFSPLD